MNGPSSMYKLKPVISLPEKIELPTCMYELKSPLNSVLASGSVMKNSSDNETADNISDKKPLPDVSALEGRWDTVLQQLADLKIQMATIRSTMNSIKSENQTSEMTNFSIKNLKVLDGAVINANINSPPYSLLLIKKLYSHLFGLSLSCHTHSSVASLPKGLEQFSQTELNSTDNLIKLLLIWKDGIADNELVLNPVKQLPIRGEVNILRFLGRLGFGPLDYPSGDNLNAIQNDSILDLCHRLSHVRTVKEKQALYRSLNSKLGRSSYFGGANVNISDISVWSALKQGGINIKDLSQNMSKWYERIDQIVE